MLRLALVTEKKGMSEETLRLHAKIAIEYSGESCDGVQFVSADCVTYEELDYQLAELEKSVHDSAQEIRRKARRSFVTDGLEQPGS